MGIRKKKVREKEDITNCEKNIYFNLLLLCCNICMTWKVRWKKIKRKILKKIGKGWEKI